VASVAIGLTPQKLPKVTHLQGPVLPFCLVRARRLPNNSDPIQASIARYSGTQSGRAKLLSSCGIIAPMLLHLGYTDSLW